MKKMTFLQREVPAIGMGTWYMGEGQKPYKEELHALRTGIEGNKVTIAHIGDSRCYLIRPGLYDYTDIENTDMDHVLYQTNDHVSHDYEWELVTKCFFSYHPEKAEPEIVQFEIQPGDRLLLCSDGVYKCIDSKVLKARIMEAKVPDDMLKAIKSGYERYGLDNYTAIMAMIE